VETPLYVAEFSTRGAVLTKWVLKKYTDSQGFPINLLKGTPEIKPMAAGRDTDFNLRSALFAVSGTDLNLSGGHPEGTLVFSYASDTIEVRRTMKFYADSYKVDVTDEIGKAASYWVTLGEDFGITSVGGTITHAGPVLLAGTDRNEFKIKKLKEPNILTPVDLKWIALEDNYFFSALVPFTAPAEVKVWELQGTSMIAMELKEGVNKYMLYAGPKDIDQLAALHLGLEHIVDFGFFSIIARPIFWLLKFINSFIGNYGWSIIILTIVLRIPFIPLLNKGQKSMKKLQELQPKMAEIKEKYKKDPQRMQREMMELYKRYKVNPMGGCLPMLLQIPFFFALYKVLLVSIELRGAPFILWIHDLSVKDPYYVLPIVMGITMLAQQKMTPTSADPSQAKIMMFMPVIFTFMFLNFSSGLVLYWLVSNLLSIVQQFFVNMAVKKEKAAAT
jgi:YidC/Oxa1 family membrane protein insertase